MSYFVCATFDIFDPTTGFFVMKMDCIEWNDDNFGPWEGPKYSTKEECYAQSVCSKADGPIEIPSNNFCGIGISDIKLINRTEGTLTFNIILPESYENTFIEYAFYDIEYNQLRDFRFVCDTPNPLPLNGTFTIQDDFTNVCAIAFRLHVPCSEQCPARTLIPVEDSGGEGSAGGHWENAARNVDYPTPDGAYYPGITYDIMDAFASGGGLRLSAACLEDMGYISSSDGYLFDRCSWSAISEVAMTHIPYIQDVFDFAASEWEKYLSYDPAAFALIKSVYDPTPWTPPGPQAGSGSGSDSGCGDGTWNGLRLHSYYEADFGPGFVAACGVYASINLDGGIGIKNNSISFFILVNTYYSGSEDFWKTVMVHEFGHALGIGTLWSGNDDFWLSKEDYPLAFEVYNSLSGSSCPPGDNCIDNANDNVTIVDGTNPGMSAHIEHIHDKNCACGNKLVLAGWKPECIATFDITKK